MKYTAGQAAKATGVATATITRALKSGKISGHKDELGHGPSTRQSCTASFHPFQRNTEKAIL